MFNLEYKHINTITDSEDIIHANEDVKLVVCEAF